MHRVRIHGTKGHIRDSCSFASPPMTLLSPSDHFPRGNGGVERMGRGSVM